ncbi:acyl-CoA N-acyltransferase [Tricladium varicosporioides]|nr:acyl-CoA N-acyltransferase [Hymenoscyphus varicosporioides]
MIQECPAQNFYTYHRSLERVRSDSHKTITLSSNTLPLTLRILLPSDISTLTQILLDPANVQDDLSVSNSTPESIGQMLQEWMNVSTPMARFNLVVLISGTLVGCSGFGWIGPVKECKEGCGRAGALGIMLDPGVRGKGYAYESLRICIDFGFRKLALEEVRVSTNKGNVAMRGLMEARFGLSVEMGEKDQFGNDLHWVIRKPWWLEFARAEGMLTLDEE